MYWKIVRIRPIENYRGQDLKVHYKAIDPATINFETHIISEVVVFPDKRNEQRYHLGRLTDHGIVKSFELKEVRGLIMMLVKFENGSALLYK